MSAAAINTPRIIQAMREKGWNKRETCVNCGIHWDSLNKILETGKIPPRLPTWYRLLNGLEITEQEALIATPHRSSRLHLVSNRWSQASRVPQDK